MTGTRFLLSAVTAAALLAVPAQAGAASGNTDEQIRQLDIMLMVTSLRCRFGADNFQADYRNFSAGHLSELNASAKRLEANLATRHGTKGAKRALDQAGVVMANKYGQGHPWLNCGQLRMITSDLAASRDPAALSQAADELLAAAPRVGGRFAQK